MAGCPEGRGLTSFRTRATGEHLGIDVYDIPYKFTFSPG